MGEESKLLSRRKLGILLCGVFFTSLSGLMFEIALTRIFSVILTYHYVFAVVSIALFGLALGGIFVYLVQFTGSEIPRPEQRFKTLAFFASAFSLSICLVTILIAEIPYTSHILIYAGLTLVPFFFAGAVLAGAFRMFALHSAKIYGADMIGAGGGCFLALLALNAFGGVDPCCGGCP